MASIIGVETLQHTNGTTAATIDSSGQLKKPNQLMFRAYYDAGEITTAQTVPFNGTYENTTGSAFNTTTGQFTVPTAGVWVFSFIGMTDTDNTANHTHVQLIKNGTNQVRGYTYKEASQHTQIVIPSHVTDCAVGDVISIYWPAQNGIDLYGNSAYYTQFNGFMLG